MGCLFYCGENGIRSELCSRDQREQPTGEKTVQQKSLLLRQAFLAERTGFEPVIPFGGIHAFQACLFNHSSISPKEV